MSSDCESDPETSEANSTDTEKSITLKQFVEQVVEFTSQYGSGGSISYTAHNLVGKPHVFPRYGDFPQAYIMRTYGPWWAEAPSGTTEIMPQNYGHVISQDFIDIVFEECVYPSSVTVYETYNPGSVVHIWAYNGQGRWVTLWKGDPVVVKHRVPRLFSPPIRAITFPTNMLRLEFDHRHLEYYAGLDAVLMIGNTQLLTPEEEVPELVQEDEVPENAGEITKRIISLNLHRLPPSTESQQPNTSLAMKVKEIEEEGVVSESIPTPSLPPPVEEAKVASVDHFKLLPFETILQIFNYLDLVSLCRCARVNRRFNSIATHTSLYLELNLKPYWHCISPDSLRALSKRCGRLKKLDLSWCRGMELRSFSFAFAHFIEDCGKGLEVLRLNNCKFLNNECLAAIAKTCKGLQELSMRSVATHRNDLNWALIAIHHLHRLDLYHTRIDINSVVYILRRTPHLQHLNLGSCSLNLPMDVVAETLSKYNRDLVSVDMWKSHNLTSAGIRCLAKCHKLEEVELGWCGDINAPGDSLHDLAMGCPRLKKLFIAALRGVSDRDLTSFVECCPLLEQIDLLGARNISPDICLRFLTQCKNLRLLDVSFCEQIQDHHIWDWNATFLKVSIKRSYAPDNILTL